MSDILNRMFSPSSAGHMISAATAALLLGTAIEHKRSALVGVATPEGWDLFTYLGDPIGAPLNVPGATIQRYQRGFIVQRDTGKVFVVYGFVADAWTRLGGPTGFVGLPTGDQQVSSNGGAWATFDGADIVWSAATGAHELHGAIRDRWHALGGPAFGYPNNDETGLYDGHGTEIGRVNTFPNGSGIYWSGSTGAWEVYGAIAGEWLGAADGGPAGVLGFPLSGETDTPDAGGRYNQFQHGVIVWHPDGPYAGAWTVLDLTLIVTGFQSSFDDIHVQVNVDVTDPAMSSHSWVPSDSDYDSDPTLGNPRLLSVPIVTPTTVMNVWMDGLGEHTFGDDERLGIIQHRYDITNLWGLVGEGSSHAVTDNRNNDYSFTANYSLQTTVPVDPNRPFRQSKFWPYHNFTTATLTDPDYAATYTDIPEGEEAFWHPFDRYFYNHTYKTSAAGGNCYGMVLAALYAIKGQSVFGEPIYDNPFLRYPPGLSAGNSADPDKEPDDARFTVPVNIMHGYQFGAAAHDWKADRRADGMSTDPLRVFRESRALHQAGELMIITLRFGDEGHAVLPYSWEENGNVRTIHIANPNNPYSTSSNDNDPSNVITITTTGSETTWTLGSGPGMWTGGTNTGGEILYCPFSLVSYRPERAGGGDIFGSCTNSAIIVVGEGTTSTVSQGGIGAIAVSPHAEFGIPGLVRVPIESAPDPAELRVGAARVFEQVSSAAREKISEIGGALHRVFETPSGSQVYRLKRPLSMETAKDAKRKAATFAARSSATRASAVGLDRLRETAAAAPADPASPAPASPGTYPTSSREMGLGRITDVENGGALREVIASTDPDPQLRWEIIADGGNSSWAMRSGAGSVVAELTGPGSTDVIQVSGALSGFPAITLSAADAAVSRTATVTLVGPTPVAGAPTRVVTISGLGTSAAGVTMQLVDGGDTLAISNAADATECSITISAGFDPAAAAHRDGVALPAGVVTTITPSAWASPLPTQQLTLQHLNAIDGTVIQQQLI